LLEGLNQPIQEKAVEAPVSELDAILVMLKKGVHGNLQCGQIPGAYSRGRLTAYAPPRPAAQSFRDLLVWRKAHEFVLGVYALTSGFPRQEMFGLSHQMRRAALSIPANIAEGFRRRGKADKARFMNLAEGSLEECRYYLILAQDLGYGDTAQLTTLIEEVSKMLNAYTAAILSSGS
jgi:four helix bundle protein